MPTCDRGGSTWSITAVAALAFYEPVRGRRDRRRDGDRDRGQRRRPGGRPARASSAGSSSAALRRTHGPGRRSPRRRSPAVSYGVWDVLDDALGRGARRPDRLAGRRRWPPARSSTAVAITVRCGCPRPSRSGASGRAAASLSATCRGLRRHTQRSPWTGSATSRSSPTSTTASRRWPTASSSSPGPSTRASTCRSCSTRWTSSASAGSRSRPRRSGSSTGAATARPTTCT